MKISSYCSIENGKVSLNGSLIYEDSLLDAKDFLKFVYKQENIDYPKFYKMDGLSKLAFLASEFVLSHSELTKKYSQEKIAIHLANSCSSLDSDLAHQHITAGKEGLASPAVFVYTLPNIAIGEISIRHKLMGDHCFYIDEKFDFDFMFDNAELLLSGDIASAVLTGWIEFLNGEYQAVLYVVEKDLETVSILEHKKDVLKRIFERSI